MIGCLYLIIVIDVFICCVFGMVVMLEVLLFVLVGLCFVYVVCDKCFWLEGLNIEMEWLMSGKFRLFYLDNVVEFKSEVLC